MFILPLQPLVVTLPEVIFYELLFFEVLLLVKAEFKIETLLLIHCLYDEESCQLSHPELSVGPAINSDSRTNAIRAV